MASATWAEAIRSFMASARFSPPPRKPYQNSGEHGKARDHISNVIEGQLYHVRKKSHDDKDDTANQNNHNAVAGTLLRR